MEPSSQPSRDVEADVRLAALLAAAGDPLRLKLLWLLRKPRPVVDLCRALGMAQPRVSHHLAVLRENGLVEASRKGRHRVYAWAGAPAGTARFELQRFLLRHGSSTSSSAAQPQPPQKVPSEPRPAPASPAADPMEDFLL